MTREYKIQDVQAFIKDYYGYEWRGFRILEDGKARTPRAWDFKGDYFSMVAILFKNNKRFVRLVEVSNVIFKIHGENNVLAHEKWQEALEQRHTI